MDESGRDGHQSRTQSRNDYDVVLTEHGLRIIETHIEAPDRELEKIEWTHRHLKYRWVRARGFWLWVLNALGCAGLTMPWGSIYLHPLWWHDLALRRHELVHIEQIDRDGPVKFSVKYLWWLVRYGYRRNPYEIEAYERAPV